MIRKLIFWVSLVVLIILGSGAYFYRRNEKNYKIVCRYDHLATIRKHPRNYKIDQIPGDMCTHVVYDYIAIRRFAEKTFDPKHHIQLKDINTLREKWPRLKILISILGEPKLKNFMHEKKNTVANVVAWLKKYKLHGVELHWEDEYGRYPEPDFKEHFSKFLQEFRIEFDKHNYILSVAVSESEDYVQKYYSIPNLTKYCDQIHVKTFKLYDERYGAVDVHSPLNARLPNGGRFTNRTVKNGLELWTKGGATKNKLIVGVRFEGALFDLDNNENHHLHAEGYDFGFMYGYAKICYNIKTQHWTKEWDDVGQVPYAYHDDKWVSYDDEESLAIKMQFIKDKDYGGVVIWSIDRDDFLGHCGSRNGLLEAINNNLKK